MLVRFSKYDFWIPGQILDFNIFFGKRILLFSKSLKNLESIREPVRRALHDCDALGDSELQYYYHPVAVFFFLDFSIYIQKWIFSQN